METFATFAVFNHKHMEEMKFYTHEEVKDLLIGEVGTPERDRYEEQLDLFLIGDAIKQARQAQNLTQEDLGKLVGVQKAQISRDRKSTRLNSSHNNQSRMPSSA